MGGLAPRRDEVREEKRKDTKANESERVCGGMPRTTREREIERAIQGRREEESKKG